MTPCLAFALGMVAGASLGCFLSALLHVAAADVQPEPPTIVPEIAPPGCCGMNRE